MKNLFKPLSGGAQNTSAERAWKILKVRNRNGYMNTRNWNSASKNTNKYNLSNNQKNIVRLVNALKKTGKPRDGGDRHRLHPNTFQRFKAGELSGQNLINQMKRNSNARGGYKGRALAKAAVVGGALALGGIAAAKYGPYVLQTIQKARNFKKNNGRVSQDEVQKLANAWKQKGFEIKNMNAFARTVRSSANTMMTPNQAKAQFNKAFINGTISMVAGGVASSLGTAVAANKLSSIASALNKAVKATSVPNPAAQARNIAAATNRINTALGVSRTNVSPQNVMRAALELKKALQTGQINRISPNTISRMYERLPELQRVFRSFTGR